METMKTFDNPGDCQNKSTTGTTGTILIETSNKKKSLKIENQIVNIVVDNNTSSSSSVTATPTGAAPNKATNKTTTAAAVVNTAGSSAIQTPTATNKLKSQQQQLQQQHQHQFRAPQQFVKHKKSASLNTAQAQAASAATPTTNANSSLNSSSNNNNHNKKQKFGNKRQHNRTAKQNANNNAMGTINTTTTTNSNNAGGGGVVMLNDSSSSIMVTGEVAAGTATSADNEEIKKADLENIQNLKNQTSGGGGGHYHHQQQQQPHHNHYSHHNNSHHAHGHHHHNHYHGIVDATTGQSNYPNPCLAAMAAEKLGYGHGHGKQTQQLHKKALPAHRSNAGGGGGGGGGVSVGGVAAGLANLVGVANHHHHHILCAVSALNTLGAGALANNANNNAPVSASNLTCCHINGCPPHHTKDNNSSNNSTVSTVSSAALHICCLRSKFFLPDKRPRKGNFIPPTKFLLGGNISDPLNLSSLQNEASNASSTNNTPATTPRQSPITTPPKVEVIIPPNIHDPLHLLDPVDSMEYEKQLTSPMKRSLGLSSTLILGLRQGGPSKMHKHRHRKNRKPKRRRYDSFNSTCSNATTIDSQDEKSAAGGSATVSMDLDSGSSLTQDSQLGLNSRADSENENEEEDFNEMNTPLQHLEKQKQLQHQQRKQDKLKATSETLNTTANTNLNARTAALNPQLNAAITDTAYDEVQLPVQTEEQPKSPRVLQQLSLENQNLLAKDNAGLNSKAARHRACRDLRLDLTNTTTSTACAAANSSLEPTALAGGGAVMPANNLGSSGRKRKVSESCNSQKGKKYFRMDSMDKIVSPVVPQPGAWKRPPRTTASGARKSQRRSISQSESTVTDLSPLEEASKSLVEEIPRDDTPELNKGDPFNDTTVAGLIVSSPLSTNSAATSINTTTAECDLESAGAGGGVGGGGVDSKNALILAEKVKSELLNANKSTSTMRRPKFPADGKKYRYGNYDRYAGLRHLNEFMDIRLQVFLQYPELFKNKDILDIGCNVGHMTISVARKLAPKSILGIDIDKELIARARRNLSMYVRIPPEVLKKESKEPGDTNEATESKPGNDIKTKKSRRRRKKKRPHQQHLQQGAQQKDHHNQHHHHHHQQQHNTNNWHHFQHHLLHYHLLHHHHHHHRHHHHHHHLYLQQESNTNVHASDFFPISFPLTYGGITSSSSGTIQQLGSSSNATTTTTTSHNNKAAAFSSPQNMESQSPASTSTTTRSTPGHPANSTNSQKANAAASTPHSLTSTSYKLQTCSGKNDFPSNVFFRQTNYVLKDESLLANDTQQYDLILCLSITKWIHLNFGDNGLKLAFKRMFNQLRPGGKLILEAQNWASYQKKKNLTEDIYNNYNNIEFYPNKFHEYLLSSEVGFSHSYTLGIPKHLSKGFSRPIQLYAKGDYTPNHVRWSDAYYPQTPFEAYRGIYATMPPRPTGLQSSYPVISSSRSQTYDTPLYSGGGGTSGPYSCRQTPMHQPSTSQYYNPLESDSYQPSYDMEYLNHMYVFASPLYQTVWSPPTSMRKSSSHTPAFGSVRDAEFEGDGTVMTGGSYHRHVYPPNDDTSSPNANAINAFNSIRDPDTDDSNQQRPHVYATNCGSGESASSPHPNLNASDAENLDESLMLDDERCDLSEA